MSDDRPLETTEEKAARLEQEFNDFKSTMLARSARMPTGFVQLAFRPTPLPGTLFLLGQTLSRTTYADLYAYFNDLGMIGAFGVGAGDNSTTFVLPNWAGRMPIGVGTLGTDTYALGAVGGAAARVLTEAQMPSHDHTLTGGGGTAFGSGDHAGHFDGDQYNAAAGSALGLAAWNSEGSTRGYHDHDVQTEVFSVAAGSSAPFDNRPPFVAINYAIWT